MKPIKTYSKEKNNKLRFKKLMTFIRDKECYKINTLIIACISKAKLWPKILKSQWKKILQWCV